MADLNAKEYQRFEEIKHTTDEGVEFWYARELAPALEYAKWDNFQKVIERAMLACKNSGLAIDDHFSEVGKMMKILLHSRLLKSRRFFMVSAQC